MLSYAASTMVNANAKTPIRKRKSVPAGGDSRSPKLLKVERGAKSPNAGAARTPNKGTNTPFKGKNTPGKGRTPRATPQNNAGTPRATPAKITKPTPLKTPKSAHLKTHKPTPLRTRKPTPARSPKQNKKQSKAPVNKLKKFKGTAGLAGAAVKVKSEKPTRKVKVEKAEDKKNKNLSVGKKKHQFTNLKYKIKLGDAAALAELEEKIKIFESRKGMSKTAKRKFRLLEKLKSKTMKGEKIEPKKNTKIQKPVIKGKVPVAKVAGKVPVAKVAGKVPVAKVVGEVNEGKLVKEEVVQKEEVCDKDEDSSNENLDAEIKLENIIKGEVDDEEESEGEDSDDEEDDGENEEDDDEEDDDENDEDDDDGDEEDDDEDGDEEEEEVEEEETTGRSKTTQRETVPRDKQYILFVSNIPFDTAKEEISEHFQKVGEVVDIRIPKDIKTNKPRGFAFVEFNNVTSFQKGLSLHHTFLKGRCINVRHNKSGKGQSEGGGNVVKVKNQKLHATKKRGQFAGRGRSGGDRKMPMRR